MSVWGVFQFVLDLILFFGFITILIRISKNSYDEMRLSRGLQLLQSKISILEDLSDKTEIQIKQSLHLIDQKIKELQKNISESEQTLRKMEMDREKSKEIAKIFQDKIPHQEIIDRQNTIKYVKAAKLANKGYDIESIINQVDLNRSEIELISKINKEHLQFSEEDLPEWALEDHVPKQDVEEKLLSHQWLPKNETPINNTLTDKSNKYQQAPSTHQEFQATNFTPPIPSSSHSLPQIELPKNEKPTKSTPYFNQEEFIEAKNSKGQSIKVKRVIFPKVQVNSNLS